jgi:hypothetical protein
MHGHWDIPSSEKNDIVHDERGLVNMGIAIVVPAQKIVDTLNLPQLQHQRAVAGAAHQRRIKAIEDKMGKGSSAPGDDEH